VSATDKPQGCACGKGHIPGPLPCDVLDAFRERCRAERLAAGLPEHVEDPAVLARIATIFRGYLADKERKRQRGRS
jgi:hypothetical protein